VVVNARGGLISLARSVAKGQKCLLVNKITGKKIPCTVANVRKSDDGNDQWDVGISFDEPSPRYWGLSFPPEDWNIAESKRSDPGHRVD
jgi:hypothetical protein